MCVCVFSFIYLFVEVSSIYIYAYTYMYTYIRHIYTCHIFMSYTGERVGFSILPFLQCA